MQFYQDVFHLPPVSEQTLFSHMQNLNMVSKTYPINRINQSIN